VELVHALQSKDPSALLRVGGLLQAAPPEQFTRIAELFAQPALTELAPAPLAAIRHFLHGYVRERRPGYAEAYARLSEIERQLSRAR